jgi:hypothetical protein
MSRDQIQGSPDEARAKLAFPLGKNVDIDSTSLTRNRIRRAADLDRNGEGFPPHRFYRQRQEDTRSPMQNAGYKLLQTGEYTADARVRRREKQYSRARAAGE